MQQKTIDAVEGMNIFPPKYKSDLEKIIKTRLAKPFERKANENIGSISPFDATKKVEALSDSNIYMEFYAISQMLNRGELKYENLNDAFFDYVYLGRGDQKIVSKDSGIDETTLKKVSDQIEQKYPIALNVAGSEHKEVHFPFSLFTHSAVLPNSFFPREYISTAHVTLNGEKMSKSKGNVLYLDDVGEFVQESSVPSISKEASLDAIRYFLMSYQALDKDLDWSEKEFVSSGLNRFKKYVNFVNNTLSGNNTDFELSTPKDKWFSTKVQRTIQDVTDSMETRKFREATLFIDDLSKNIMRYRSFPDSQSGFVNSAIETELTLMYPFTPRLSRELANQFLGKSIQSMPLFNLEYVFPEEHDQLEHELSGEKYVGFINSSLKRSLNIEKGKNLNGDNYFNVLFPSEYSLELVKHKPRLAELLQGHSLSVDKRVRFPTIESSRQP
jgi:leucyl-tRNA synthetase